MQTLLADMGARAVAGQLFDVDFELAWPADSGTALSALVSGGAFALLRRSGETDGIYVSVKLPRSLMADLLLESNTHSAPDEESDQLEPFRWSGTSEDWVRKQIEGPLLSMLARQNQYRSVSVTDEIVRIGPLSRDVEPAAREVIEILSAVRDHFD